MIQNLQTRLNAYSPAVLSVFRIVFGLMFTLNGTVKLFGWPAVPQQSASDGDATHPGADNEDPQRPLRR